jgi:hypothetical protein|tara:strand:- start:130 stop:1275 length:1146 start_codon:yes stop_codon:yes gene_type:complete
MQGYQVGDRFFTYLIDAGDYAVRTNQRVVYNFHDEVFSKIDWRQRIDVNLPTLYAERARQIRDTYDYVIITYSGGADSQNVLDTFLNNDIRIDEIVIWHDKDITHTDNNRTNREALGVALKRAERIVAERPEIRLRILGSMDTVNAFHANKDFDAKLQINQPWGGIMVPQRRGYWKNLVDDYRKLVDLNKKVAVVWGYDRPTVIFDKVQNKFFTYFEDRAQGYLPTALDLPIDNVLFYWSEQVPLIPVKMAQVIVDKLREIPVGFQDPYLRYYRQIGNGDFQESHNGNKISRTLVNNWIYPTWDPTTFTEGKCLGNFFINNELDYWVTDRCNEDAVRTWARNLRNYRDQFEHFNDHLYRVVDFESFKVRVGFTATKSYYLE